MGGDNFKEFPIVRFKAVSSAEPALAAIKAGVLFLDGHQLKGDYRGGGGRAVRQRGKDGPGGPPAIADRGPQFESRNEFAKRRRSASPAKAKKDRSHKMAV